jgi:hypothetical protein
MTEAARVRRIRLRFRGRKGCLFCAENSVALTLNIGRPQYCLLDNPDTFGNIDTASGEAPPGPQVPVAGCVPETCPTAGDFHRYRGIQRRLNSFRQTTQYLAIRRSRIWRQRAESRFFSRGKQSGRLDGAGQGCENKFACVFRCSRRLVSASWRLHRRPRNSDFALLR